MVKVKICGITNLEDALASVHAGADALGFNFYSKSPRFILPAKAQKIIQSLPPFISKVGIFVNESKENILKIIKEIDLDFLQFHADESPADCEGFNIPVIKAFSIKNDLESARRYHAVSAILLDTPHDGNYGGTGRIFDWSLVQPFKEIGKPLILSGGLTIQNVEQALRQVKPYAVDVCSGVESQPGKKDYQKILEFIKKVKNS